MKNKDVMLFCNYLYNCTNIPIWFYEKDTLMLQLPPADSALDIVQKYLEVLVNQPQSVTYIVTKQFLYIGIVKIDENKDSCVVIGPITNVLLSKEMTKKVMQDALISLSHINQINELINSFPKMTFERFLHTLCFLNYSINDKKLTMEDILDYKNRKILFPIATEHTSKIFNAKEEQHFHNTYQFEKQYLNIIENGDLAALKKLLEAPIVITPGVVADNGIRQIKNLFIAGITLVTRAAIKGGLDMESAYQLSDVYIQKMEKLHSVEDIYNLQYQLMFDFTERVLVSKIPSGISLSVYECINYINANTNRPITVEDVAANVNKSRSFISRKFKQELGFGINEFINSRKIEEAKYLLTYTNKSISEISFYLCFSSQSYFQNVFKKKLGITPNDYRLKTISNKDI
jgi:YSIRK-targeted surface antigen transcriptional regulator